MTIAEAPDRYTSSYSDNGGARVEVALNLAGPSGTVPVRDSKRANSPMLARSAAL
ncbi:DUF397 domain-containing protein [Streptomyces sp. NPDC001889]